MTKNWTAAEPTLLIGICLGILIGLLAGAIALRISKHKSQIPSVGTKQEVFARNVSGDVIQINFQSLNQFDSLPIVILLASLGQENNAILKLIDPEDENERSKS